MRKGFSFSNEGMEIRQGVLTSAELAAVKADISLQSDKLQTYGIRNLEKKFTSIATLANSPRVLSIATELLNKPVKLVRAIFFDKTPQSNWLVSWHQDKTVTLNQRHDLSGWGPWSLKDGVCHVQPPVAVLNEMVTIRLHIDDCDEHNGCLQVMPGSHQYGILATESLQALVKTSTSVACSVAAGDAVIMRPHIVHSSSKSQTNGHRRVVHLEYCSYELPPGLTWA